MKADQVDDPDMAHAWDEGYIAGLDYARSTRLRPPPCPYRTAESDERTSA